MSADDAPAELRWTEEQRAAARRLLPYAGGSPALDRLAALAKRLLQTEVGQASLLTDVQTVAAVAGLGAEFRGRETPLEDSFCVVGAVSGQPLVVADARVDPRVAERAPAVLGEIGSYLGVPLVLDSGVAVGALCVYNEKPREWSQSDIEALTQLATVAVAELELAAVTREYDTDRARWEMAVEASAVGTFDLDLASGDFAWDDRLIALYGYDRGDVGFDRSIDSVRARVHPDDLERVFAVMQEAIDTIGPLDLVYRVVVPPGHVRWLEARGRALPGADGRAGRLLGVSWDVTAQQVGQARADRVVADMPVGYVSLDQDWRVTSVNAQGARFVMMSPEEMRGQVIWDAIPELVDHPTAEVLRRVRRTGVRETLEVSGVRFSERWFEIQVVSELDGISIYSSDVTDRHETQRRIEQAAAHDRTVAQTLQSVLLTDLPRSPHLRMAARYATAAEADEIGGDWYDVVLGEDGRATLTIGDVMGHDIDAAAGMGQLRAMLRAFCWERADAASEIVSRLDRAARGLTLRTVASLAVCVVEPDGGDGWTMQWSNAGHLPPILVHPDGTIEILAASRSDLLIGIEPTVERHDHARALPIGSIVVLYTDGLVERRTDDIDVGIGELAAALARHCCTDPAGVDPDRLVDAVLGELISGSPDDDAAVFAIRLGDPPRG